MKKELIFSNLDEIAVEKEALSNKCEIGKWRIAEYEAGGVCGKMLIAPEESLPKNITLNINLSGVYKIYVCFSKLRMENYLYIKTTGD